jgi:site-specific DNA-cytosine methylase
LAVAEVSLQTLAATLGADIHTVFACDIWSGSRHWLQTIGIQPTLADMHTRVWNKEAGRITTRDIHGNAIQISTKDDIDLYVCGFMRTPFTPNGRRKEWADEHAKTFFSAVKTISTLRPRVAILESVMAISNNWNAKVVKRALDKLVDYVICYVKVNSTDHGVPHQ